MVLVDAVRGGSDEELLAEPISERPEVRTPAHGAAGDGGGAGAGSVGLDVITLQLDHAALRFEAHDNDNYEMPTGTAS